MKRADRSRILYVCALVAGTSLVAAICWYLQLGINGIVLFGLLLLIPGRIPSIFWRSFYQGQRQFRLRLYDDAATSFERFLEQLEARPWLAKLIYLKWGIHTWDIAAMTWNNLGSSRLHLGDLDGAETAFHRSLDVDSDYAIPYINLAIVSVARGDVEEAERRFERSRELGSRKMTFEHVVGTGERIRESIGSTKA